MWTFIKQHPLWIAIAAAVIILLLMIKTGMADKPLKMVEEILASKYVDAVKTLDVKLKATEVKNQDLTNKIKAKDAEIAKVRADVVALKGRLKDAEDKLINIKIPTDVPGIVTEFHNLGYPSARAINSGP